MQAPFTRALVALIFAWFCLPGYAQVKNIGMPQIQNYPKSVYDAGTQNWDISQDQNGFMYFANNEGVLRFDGLHWDLTEISQPSPVRSICIDSENQIYVGLFNDFGILQLNEEGRHSFQSLRSLLPDENIDFDDIWKIYEIPQGIVFQSFDYLFLLNNNTIEVIKPESSFHFSYFVDGRLFLHEPEVGLFEYINGRIEKVPWAGELKGTEIWAILEIRDNHLIIGTRNNGLYKFENGELVKWQTPVNDLVIENKLYSATKIGDNQFAFGTILGGVIISDLDGNIVKHINRRMGLQNSTVLNIFSDSDQNLWLALDNGIDFLAINSPLSYIADFEGLGTGYCSRVFDGNLYLGTNQGLFVKPFSSSQNTDENFELVENTAGQVWSLDEFDGQLICGHNSGTFVIRGKEARKISNEPGAWKYIRLQNHPELLLGGHYSGLTLLRKGDNGWEFYKNVKGFNESSRFLQQDKNGIIWVSHGGKGVFRVQLNEAMDEVINSRLYTSSDGLPADEMNILFTFGGNEYISTIDGIFEYQDSTDSFVFINELNEKFNFNSRLKTLETDDSGNVWFIAQDESGVLRQNEDLTYTKITAPFKPLNGKFVNEFEFIYPLSNDHVFIGIDDGFVHYSSKIPKSYSMEFQAFITKIEAPYLDSTLHLFPVQDEIEWEVPFRKNAFRFHYTAPYFENLEQLQFSFFLENYSEEWSEWTTDRYRDFTNLPEGDYVFRLKAKNIYGVESDVASFPFVILPPWHRSQLAMYSYAFFLMLIILLTVKFVLNRMEHYRNKEKQKLELELQKKKEQFQHQALVAEKEIIRLRNEKLQNEMLYRDKELANQTMSIIHKNKFLMKLKEEIQRMIKATDDSQQKTRLVLLNKRLAKEIDNQQQNKIFETYFDEVHNDFFKNLKQKFPELSPREMRICAYIRMNLSSKEIAALLNITDRGVEISRYRLRKKLKLSRDTNLSTFLSNI